MTSTAPGTDPASAQSAESQALPRMRTSADAAVTPEEEIIAAAAAAPPLPQLRRRSGIYTRRVVLPFRPSPSSIFISSLIVDSPPDGAVASDVVVTRPGGPAVESPAAVPPTAIAGAGRIRFATEQLRVDVDGRAPTMTVSGVVPGGLATPNLTWIARVTLTAADTYAGPISYRDGTGSLLPQTHVEVRLLPPVPIGPLTALVTFTGGGATPLVRAYTLARSDFREVNFEFDTASDATAVTSYDTASHPNRPAGLPAETLTIETGYRHMGISVTRSGDSVVDVSAAGPNVQWSDIEMHDAMQVNWSRFADIPQWALWVFFARQHEMGPSLGGIMFDDIGTAQRQGTAIFSESFVANAPAGDPAPAAWVQRMLFWTAMHEIGHAFNLAHSWQKSLGTGWIPLSNEVEARSYMNYPYRVAPAPGKTPEQAFFANFEFRFSDGELLFMRHAPERFVQQGNALWFDHHAFEQARAATSSPLELVARVNRSPRFEFLEPVKIELKLKNVTSSPLVVDRRILEGDRITLVVTKRGAEPRVIRPYARRCFAPDDVALMPGESLYGSVYVSSDVYGFTIDDPGQYAVYAMLDLDEVDVLAEPLRLRVMLPANREEERFADDVLRDDVGRTLAFGGSRVLNQANETLREAVERLADRPLALHAQAALGTVAARPGKVLEPERPGEKRVVVEDADLDTALSRLGAAYGDLQQAATTFGHIDATKGALDYAATLKKAGEADQAATIAENLADTLAERGVKPSVVDAARAAAAELRG